MQGEVIAVGPGGRDESGKLIPIDVKAGDTDPVRQMVGHRGQDRRRGIPDHEGIRHHGRDRRNDRQEGCRLKFRYPLNSNNERSHTWLPRT